MRHVLRLLPPAVLLTALVATATPPAQANQGVVTHKLQYVQAVLENGSAAPQFDAACKKQLSTAPTRFVGLPVRTRYAINTKPSTMTAVSSFPSPVPTQPLQLSVNLNSLGIANTYAFGTFRPAQVKSVYAVLFSIDTAFQKSNSTFVVFGPEGGGYNCVISSERGAALRPESSQFKSK